MLDGTAHRAVTRRSPSRADMRKHASTDAGAGQLGVSHSRTLRAAAIPDEDARQCDWKAVEEARLIVPDQDAEEADSNLQGIALQIGRGVGGGGGWATGG